jgi:predicted aspartyl protease
MYEVHTEITLKNGEDVTRVRDGNIKETEIRQVTVDAVVDTGAWTLVINEDTRLTLGLPVRNTDTVNLAGGETAPCTVVSPVEVWWKDRRTLCDAIVLQNAKEILLGAIPMEAMDITVDTRLGKVAGAHGDQIVHRLY